MSVGVVRETVLSTLRAALEEARATGDLRLPTLPALVLDVPRKETWGDLATTVAMNLAASEQRAPCEIAEIIAGRLRGHPDVLERIEVVPPGFINLTIKRDLWFRVLSEIEAQGERYGCSDLGLGKRVLVEFVSANPTGPLHMGHGRGAAVGGALAKLLRHVGYDVSTEYYINDAGRQVRLLTESVAARCRELLNQPDVQFPEDGYRGAYVREIAKKVIDKAKAENLELLLVQWEGFCKAVAYNIILDEIRTDLKAFGLHFDNWFSESSLFESGAVTKSLDTLKAQGALFEQDGAQWFRSTAFGDDKDRVVRKQDGEYTYLASDIAYHRDKLARGYDLLINIWGADHHGYIPRMEAAVQAFGHPKERLKIVLVQIVNLMRGGQRVTMSKRGGELITLREVLEEVGSAMQRWSYPITRKESAERIGADAAKFIFLTRRADSHLDFDLAVAMQKSAENPVYYVQYAHARVASLLRVAEVRFPEEQRRFSEAGEVDWTLLNLPDDLDLIRPLAEYPALLEASAQALEPHRLTYYLQDLAARLHAYYYKHRILPPALEHELESQDPLKPVVQDSEQVRKGEMLTLDLIAARLRLFRCVKTVIRNGLDILGVSAPERM
jgi:arginyl-tRNA synthetase